MAKTAVIKYFEDKCIGCRACVAVSGNWVENGEKVRPLKTKVSGKEIGENKKAEAVCPVQAIKVTEK
ncbi:MAG: ferredoxin [Candidatus ainarchaeum sp.]|nr:ferredoxin [Candidatus ainarchaeum sp.]